MVTKQEALTEYNLQNNTNYSLTTLATHLVNVALRDAWMHKRRTEAQAAADSEVIS